MAETFPPIEITDYGPQQIQWFINCIFVPAIQAYQEKKELIDIAEDEQENPVIIDIVHNDGDVLVLVQLCWWAGDPIPLYEVPDDTALELFVQLAEEGIPNFMTIDDELVPFADTELTFIVGEGLVQRRMRSGYRINDDEDPIIDMSCAEIVEADVNEEPGELLVKLEHGLQKLSLEKEEARVICDELLRQDLIKPHHIDHFFSGPLDSLSRYS